MLVAVTAACGDDPPAAGVPLAPATELVIIAHQGDELRYMGNDAVNAIGDVSVTTVVVTDGRSELMNDHAADATDARPSETAYAFLADAPAGAWQCGPIAVNGHTVRHCRLEERKLSLVFLDLPTGNHDGSAADSLRHLWEAKAPTIASTTDATVTYSQADLIGTLSAIIAATAPNNLRTLEIAGTHGDDHSDHMLVGAATWLALAATPVRTPTIFAYRGDNIAAEPENVMPTARTEQALGFYAACALDCAPCGQACQLGDLPAPESAVLLHSYPILAASVRAGQFQIGTQCASFPDGVGDNGTLVDCPADDTPKFTYTSNDLVIRDPGGCVRSLFTAELVEDSACAADDPGVHFLYDQDQHLWFGVVPAPAADMSFSHLVCMDAAGGRPRGVLCGASHDVTVTLGQPPPN